MVAGRAPTAHGKPKAGGSISIMSTPPEVLGGGNDQPIVIAEEHRRYKLALESLRTMQGVIVPVHNDEMVPVSWVLEVVDLALNHGDQTDTTEPK